MSDNFNEDGLDFIKEMDIKKLTKDIGNDKMNILLQGIRNMHIMNGAKKTVIFPNVECRDLFTGPSGYTMLYAPNTTFTMDPYLADNRYKITMSSEIKESYELQKLLDNQAYKKHVRQSFDRRIPTTNLNPPKGNDDLKPNGGWSPSIYFDNSFCGLYYKDVIEDNSNSINRKYFIFVFTHLPDETIESMNQKDFDYHFKNKKSVLSSDISSSGKHVLSSDYANRRGMQLDDISKSYSYEKVFGKNSIEEKLKLCAIENAKRITLIALTCLNNGIKNTSQFTLRNPIKKTLKSGDYGKYIEYDDITINEHINVEDVEEAIKWYYGDDDNNNTFMYLKIFKFTSLPKHASYIDNKGNVKTLSNYPLGQVLSNMEKSDDKEVVSKFKSIIDNKQIIFMSSVETYIPTNYTISNTVEKIDGNYIWYSRCAPTCDTVASKLGLLVFLDHTRGFKLFHQMSGHNNGHETINRWENCYMNAYPTTFPFKHDKNRIVDEHQRNKFISDERVVNKLNPNLQGTYNPRKSIFTAKVENVLKDSTIDQFHKPVNFKSVDGLVFLSRSNNNLFTKDIF